MMFKLYKDKFNAFVEYALIFCFSLHIFFWSSFQNIEYKINFAGINLLNSKITIIFIFFYYLLSNYKSFLQNNFNLIIIFSLLMFHLILNFDHNFFIYEKLLKLLIIFFIFIICNNYYNFIIKNLEKIIFLFLIIIFSVLIYDLFDDNFLNNLKHKNIKFNLFFFEESHLAIMIIPTIFFLIFNKKSQFSISSVSGLVTAFFVILLFYSTTLLVGFFLIMLFLFIFCFNEFLKRIVLIAALVVVCISSLYLSKHFKIQQRNFFNDNKVTDSLTVINEIIKDDIKKMIFFKDYTNDEHEYFYYAECDEPITNKNYSDKWKNQTEDIGSFFKNNEICLPIKRNDKLDLLLNKNNDISIAVFLNSSKVTFFSVKEKFYGYGLNNYESSHAKQMVNNIVPTHFEAYFLNYNDASSNLWKLICELGIFSGLFLFILIKYIFSKNILVGHKLFFISIILLQFIRGAGYVNGGFAFSFAMMLTHFFNNTTLFFKKK
jgi:hypothetical protein